MEGKTFVAVLFAIAGLSARAYAVRRLKI